MKTKAEQIIETLNKWNVKQKRRCEFFTPNYIQQASKAIIKHAGELKEVEILKTVFFLN